MLSSTSTEIKGPRDDWTGLKDAKARRRIQTRLHVRAHRKKKALLANVKGTSSEAASQDCDIWAAALRSIIQQNDGTADKAITVLPSLTKELLRPGPTFTYMSRLVAIQEAWYYQGDGPQPLAFFPLSRDHLIPVTQYNVMRAMTTNMGILGIDDFALSECQLFWTVVPSFPKPSEMPSTLAPTTLQLTTPHQRWIDLLPHPRMRDNAIREAGRYDSDDLEEDIMGYVCDDPVAIQKGPRTVLVWEDPWRPESYELSPEFIEKWAFLVKGCHELFKATNRWRRKRGEQPLRFSEDML